MISFIPLVYFLAVTFKIYISGCSRVCRLSLTYNSLSSGNIITLHFESKNIKILYFYFFPTDLCAIIFIYLIFAYLVNPTLYYCFCFKESVFSNRTLNNKENTPYMFSCNCHSGSFYSFV